MAEETSDVPGDEALAGAKVPRGGFRHRMRTNSAVRPFYRGGVFLLGLIFIAAGIGLAVLPGPLTIPPVLLGLYIWSTEFAFAERFFESFKEKGRDAWEHAQRHPIPSALATAFGLVTAAAAMWAVAHFDLVQKGRDALGL
jgi:hypothetical protein